MKKIFASVALVASMALVASPAFADTATSTAVVMPGGHEHAHLAGSIDSIHNKGAWCLSNVYPYWRTIFYVADGTTNGGSCNFAQVFAAMNYK